MIFHARCKKIQPARVLQGCGLARGGRPAAARNLWREAAQAGLLDALLRTEVRYSQNGALRRAPVSDAPRRLCHIPATDTWDYLPILSEGNGRIAAATDSFGLFALSATHARTILLVR